MLRLIITSQLPYRQPHPLLLHHRIVRALRRNRNADVKKSGSYTIPAPTDTPDVEYLAKVGAGVELQGDVSFGGMNSVGPGSRIAHGVSLGLATTISAECWLRGPASLGNYCQLGPRVCIQAANHNLRLLTPYSSTPLFGGGQKATTQTTAVALGHGVWCGYGSIILKGVTIGNGAVIGAGAIVTRDVPAYHIAVGNPARVIARRYDVELCDLVEQTQWWTYTSKELEVVRECFSVDFQQDPAEAHAALLRMIQHLPRTPRAGSNP